MSFTRLALAGGLLVAGTLASAANATCVGTAVCEESRPVMVCVDTGSGGICTTRLYLPLCVHGQIGSGYYQTVWC